MPGDRNRHRDAGGLDAADSRRGADRVPVLKLAKTGDEVRYMLFHQALKAAFPNRVL